MRFYISLLNYFFISFILLRLPIAVITEFDGRGRIPFLLSILVFLLNLIINPEFRRLLISKPIIIWGIWVVYSAINLLFKGYHEPANIEQPYSFYVILELFTPFLIMLIAALEWLYASKKFLFLLLITFTIYGVFTLYLRDSTAGFGLGRNMGELGNSGALNTMFIILFSGLLLTHKSLKLSNVIALVAFAFSVIILLATRKAFAACIIMTAFLVLSQIELAPKKIALVTILSLSIVLGANFVLKNTILGERFATTEKIGAEFNTTDNEILNLLGDRAVQYILAWDIFLDNYTTGIGLRNFMAVSKYGWRLHTEYMVQITEGGIVGAFIFLLFNAWILKNMLKGWMEHPQTRSLLLVLAGGFIAILFINLTAWTFSFSQYFVCFGVTIGYLKTINENSNP